MPESLLNKHGYHMVFEYDEFVLSKSRLLVGKGCVSDGMFNLNVVAVKLRNIMEIILEFTCLGLPFVGW